MELNIKTKEQIFHSVNDGICKNKYWIEKDNMIEFLLDYRKKFDKSNHVADRKLVVYINSFVNEIKETVKEL